ncbi:MAG TPA: PilZ domain-containing protein [Candidatus Saccharimonadales bacterium]|nr:PilZ domain-containing protein [Candidatus Saccharimonadales bacterium]
MTLVDQCSLAGCVHDSEGSIDGQTFCREHFISVCYERLDSYDEKRKGPGLTITDSESVRRFIHDCTRSADEMEHNEKNLDNLDRAKLLHIILYASELGRHLRRSPRKIASIPVTLSSEKIGGAWKENTETVLLSQHGAMVLCKHAAKSGDTVHVKREDTGQETDARVAWQRTSNNDEIRLAVEFTESDNFWGLDWGLVEEDN